MLAAVDQASPADDTTVMVGVAGTAATLRRAAPPAGPKPAPGGCVVLAAIDATPVAYRRELGADLLGWLEECSRVTEEGAWLWKSRNLRIPGRPALLFSVTTRFTDLTMPAFGSLVMLRHQEWRELMPEAHPLTVGVLITPSRQARLWDTTMLAVRNDIDFSGEERRVSEDLWNQNWA